MARQYPKFVGGSQYVAGVVEQKGRKGQHHNKKRSTPPRDKRSTLRNINPKKEIEEQERFTMGLKMGFLGRHGDPELQRIAVRAAQMVDNAVQQAA